MQSSRVQNLFWGTAVIAIALFVGASQRIWGDSGLQGSLLGVSATGFNMIALWGIVSLLGRSFQEGKVPRLGSSFAVIAFFIKLPLFVAFGIIAQRIGGNAPTCFLLGLALVYSLLIGWAIAKS